MKKPLVEGLQNRDLFEAIEEGYKLVHAGKEVPRTFYKSILKSIGHFSNARDVAGLEKLINTLEHYSRLGGWNGAERSYVAKIIKTASFVLRRLEPQESFEAIMGRIAKANMHKRGFGESLGAMVNPKIKRRI